jgi:hypothetical protein
VRSAYISFAAQPDDDRNRHRFAGLHPIRAQSRIPSSDSLPIRELFNYLAQPDMIWFAGGYPASDLFDGELLDGATARASWRRWVEVGNVGVGVTSLAPLATSTIALRLRTDRISQVAPHVTYSRKWSLHRALATRSLSLSTGFRTDSVDNCAPGAPLSTGIRAGFVNG